MPSWTDDDGFCACDACRGRGGRCIFGDTDDAASSPNQQQQPTEQAELKKLRALAAQMHVVHDAWLDWTDRSTSTQHEAFRTLMSSFAEYERLLDEDG